MNRVYLDFQRTEVSIIEIKLILCYIVFYAFVLLYFLPIGKDLIIARRRAKDKLVEESDMLELLEEADKNIKSFVLNDESKSDAYTEKYAIELRDNLILAGAIRLARRSKEIMTMQLKEVEDAEEVDICGQNMFIVKVINWLISILNILLEP